MLFTGFFSEICERRLSENSVSLSYWPPTCKREKKQWVRAESRGGPAALTHMRSTRIVKTPLPYHPSQAPCQSPSLPDPRSQGAIIQFLQHPPCSTPPQERHPYHAGYQPHANFLYLFPTRYICDSPQICPTIPNNVQQLHCPPPPVQAPHSLTSTFLPTTYRLFALPPCHLPPLK